MSCRPNPRRCSPLLETAIRSGCFGAREGPALLVLIGYAETLVPDAELSSMSDDDRTNLVTFLRWAADPEILRLRGRRSSSRWGTWPTCTRNSGAPPRGWRRSRSRSPRLAERAEYIQHLQAANGFTMEMTPEQLAHVTAGLSRLHLRTLCRRASRREAPLTYTEVTERKREILKRELQGMIEVVEPALGLNVIGGHGGGEGLLPPRDPGDQGRRLQAGPARHHPGGPARRGEDGPCRGPGQGMRLQLRQDRQSTGEVGRAIGAELLADPAGAPGR